MWWAFCINNFMENKKGVYFLLIIFFLFLGSFQYSEATSGACSSHSGVNCSRGMQVNGKVYCNDGWTESMVWYSFMSMCQSSLDPKCVNDAIAYINGKDTYIRDIDKEIDAYINSNITSDPVDIQLMNAHLNYLYTLRGRQNASYVQMVIDSCKNYKTNDQICSDKFGSNSKWDGTKNSAGGVNCGCKTGYIWNEQITDCIIAPVVPIQNKIKQSGILCNGKYWGDCSVGYKFYCPISGDAQCNSIDSVFCNGKYWKDCPAGRKFYCPISGDPQCVIPTPIPTQNIANITPKSIITPSQSPKQEKALEQVTTTNKDKEPLKNPSENKGLFPKLWSWFKGLFSFNH